MSRFRRFCFWVCHRVQHGKRLWPEFSCYVRYGWLFFGFFFVENGRANYASHRTAPKAGYCLEFERRIKEHRPDRTVELTS